MLPAAMGQYQLWKQAPRDHACSPRQDTFCSPCDPTDSACQIRSGSTLHEREKARRRVGVSVFNQERPRRAFHLEIAAPERYQGLWCSPICALYAAAYFSDSFGRVRLRCLDAGSHRRTFFAFCFFEVRSSVRRRCAVCHVADGQEPAGAKSK